MTTKTSEKINLKPAPGYLLIEPASVQTQTLSGIYLPDSAGEKPQKGTVVAIGDDEITEKGITKSSPAKVGAIVIYKKWGGNEVKMNGKDYLFVKFEDILAMEVN
jgi:chaperonin GroES